MEIFRKDNYFLYVKVKNTDFEEERKGFMNHIVGRSNVVCGTHNIPLIASVNKSYKCKCGKKEYVTYANAAQMLSV